MQIGWRPVQGDELVFALEQVLSGLLTKFAAEQIEPFVHTLADVQMLARELHDTAAQSKILQKLGYQGIAEQLELVCDRLLKCGDEPNAEATQKVLAKFNDDLNISLTRFAEHTDSVLGYIDDAVEKIAN